MANKKETKDEGRIEAERREKYVCIGSVREWCGHRHTSVRTAMNCIRKDRARCKDQGGYSDRLVYHLSDVRDDGKRVWKPSSSSVSPVDLFEVE